MSTTIDIIKDALWEWIYKTAGLTDADVYWQKEKMPRPKGSKVSLRLLSMIPLGFRDERRPFSADADTEQFPTIGQREGMLSVNFYGDDAEKIIEHFSGRIHHKEYSDSIEKLRRVVVDILEVEDGDVFTFKIDGIPFTVEAGVDTTPSDVAESFVSAFDEVQSWLHVYASADDAQLTLTGPLGMDFDLEITEGDEKAEIVTDSPAVFVAIIGQSGNTDDLSFLETEQEHRMHLDLLFRTALRSIDRPGVIEKVQITESIFGTTITIGGD
ncbi:MAG: hypothetical protein M0Q12_00105 [Synergistaceae bacterium]|jgi:hypothetical protein|nr:hypothetical protein [Synergistaceae bacterium]